MYSTKEMNLILFFFFLLNFLLYMFVPISKMIEFELIHSWFNITFSLAIDKFSLIFLYTVLFIYCSVSKFTDFYMELDLNFKRFKQLLMLFVSSMVLMILSGDLFTSFIAWDCLGISSLLLIMYYYSSKTLEASILVYLMNRVGDCCFLITLIYSIVGSYSLFFLHENVLLITSMMLFFTSITKSAQVPFSSWLPAAMEAPTPVSALVHSSTLVTAGLYLMFRYQNLWYDNQLVCILLMILASCTSYLASTVALMEMDMKKIIALSTLSQLGFIMLIFSMGLLEMGFFHMIMHAYFKALLFMVAGVVIHNCMGNQSLLKLSIKNSPSLMIMFYTSILSMSGAPFLSGFYSKDVILDTILFKSYIFFPLFFIFISFLMTIIYSIRILWFLLHNNLMVSVVMDDNKMFISTLWMNYLMSCISGGMMIWFIFPINMYVDNSKILIMSCLLMMLLYTWMSKPKNMMSKFFKSKWYLDNLVKILFMNTFKMTKLYNKSSDMFSIPGFYNSYVVNQLNKLSEKINKQVMFYFNLFDMFVMILVLSLVILLMN